VPIRSWPGMGTGPMRSSPSASRRWQVPATPTVSRHGRQFRSDWISCEAGPSLTQGFTDQPEYSCRGPASGQRRRVAKWLKVTDEPAQPRTCQTALARAASRRRALPRDLNWPTSTAFWCRLVPIRADLAETPSRRSARPSPSPPGRERGRAAGFHGPQRCSPQPGARGESFPARLGFRSGGERLGQFEARTFGGLVRARARLRR
jgi:hypothetical protein